MLILRLFRQRNSKWRHGPVAKIATGELNDKERGAEVRRTVHRGRYIITEKSLREFQVGGSVFRAVVRLNVSRIAPRTFRVDAHTTFINERIFRLPFWPPVSLSLFRHLISPTPSRLPHGPLLPVKVSLETLVVVVVVFAVEGKIRGTLSGRVFPAYYLSDPTSISGPRAFPCREIMHSPSERRREGRRLPRDRDQTRISG